MVADAPAAPSPYGEARDDYAIFADLAERLGAREAFTEGRSVAPVAASICTSRPRDGLARARACRRRASTSSGQAGGLMLPQQPDDGGSLARLPRRSGGATRCRRRAASIEIFSATIAGFGDADCPGHPAWLDADATCRAPARRCVLVANQPATRLHSQLDFGGHSADAKHRGREVARMHPARRRGARHRRRRHRPPVQRARRLPRRRPT